VCVCVRVRACMCACVFMYVCIYAGFLLTKPYYKTCNY